MVIKFYELQVGWLDHKEDGWKFCVLHYGVHSFQSCFFLFIIFVTFIMLQISLVSEKKDNMFYNEKFTHLRFPPSVRYFGGRPMEGCLVISTTGMVGVVIASREGHQGSPQLIITSDSLGSTRHRITAVDICYGKSQHLSTLRHSFTLQILFLLFFCLFISGIDLPLLFCFFLGFINPYAWEDLNPSP
jgi:hypothetical protein